VLFALALLDACIIGAAAVSLATAYAIGDVLEAKHSLHRKPWDAKGFYGVYFGLILLAAILVLTPGTPLGLLTNAVRTLTGGCDPIIHAGDIGSPDILARLGASIRFDRAALAAHSLSPFARSLNRIRPGVPRRPDLAAACTAVRPWLRP
jgi:hypothetical protein